MRSSTELETPIGPVRIEAEDGFVVAVHLPGEPARRSSSTPPLPTSVRPERRVRGDAASPKSRDEGDVVDPVLAEARRQLEEYFDGRRTDFDLPLRGGGTPFQEAVWAALRAIPAGETRSYADVARAVGKPDAVRAVGAANGRNPIAIVVPCHRVIGSNGTLTGYAGGLETKRWLLAHERASNGPLFTAAAAAARPGRGRR